MVFSGKFGNILQQTVSKQVNSGFSVSKPSIYQSIRYMSSSKLFGGGAFNFSLHTSSFIGEFENIPRQTVMSKQVNSGCSVSNSSIHQGIRNPSSSKLFIGGLSYSTDETSLKEAFHKYGEVVEALVIVDRDTGKSRGFGFVTFTSSKEASSAIQALNGQDLQGRRVRVNFATDRARSDGYGGGGNGGDDLGGLKGGGLYSLLYQAFH